MIRLTLSFLILILFQSSVLAQVVAKVGNKEITLKEFKEKFETAKKMKFMYGLPPTPEAFLEDLIRYEVGVQEAERKGLRNDPIVQERFKEEIYKVFVDRAISDKISKIKVKESEMKKKYKENPEIRLRHILFSFKENATDEEKSMAKKRAEEIYGKIKGSKRPFEELVKLYTDDTYNKDNGGDLGFQSKVTLVPEVYNTLLKMKPGEVRGLIETRYGFHIIQYVERRGYEDADPRQIRAAVFEDKRKAVFDEFFEKLKKSYKISVNNKAIVNVK